MAPHPRPTFRAQVEEALGGFAGIVGYLLFQVAREDGGAHRGRPGAGRRVRRRRERLRRRPDGARGAVGDPADARRTGG
ncbi:hypothetical protein [Clavibacter tessellarius]|uniref:hypothetical protein n=1 Tax=Clavibacter tessellarius TaxID=31965 RepID=UPI0032547F10